MGIAYLFGKVRNMHFIPREYILYVSRSRGDGIFYPSRTLDITKQYCIFCSNITHSDYVLQIYTLLLVPTPTEFFYRNAGERFLQNDLLNQCEGQWILL